MKDLKEKLLNLIEVWFLPRREKIVPEARKEIMLLVERIYQEGRKSREKEIISILETNINRLNPKIVKKIVGQLIKPKGGE